MGFDPLSFLLGSKSGGGSGGGLPAVTSDDIGKTLKVIGIPQYVTLVPEQFINVSETQDEMVLIPIRAENADLFVAGASVTITGLFPGAEEPESFDSEARDVGEYIFAKIIAKSKSTGEMFLAVPGEQTPVSLTLSATIQSGFEAEWDTVLAAKVYVGQEEYKEQDGSSFPVFNFGVSWLEVFNELYSGVPVYFCKPRSNSIPDAARADMCMVIGVNKASNSKYKIYIINPSADEWREELEFDTAEEEITVPV